MKQRFIPAGKGVDYDWANDHVYVKAPFDGETVEAGVGSTVIIPPGVWHEVSCPEGGRLLTVFTPGGFDHYLSELAAMAPEQLDDADAVQLLGETYDLWTREPTSPA